MGRRPRVYTSVEANHSAGARIAKTLRARAIKVSNSDGSVAKLSRWKVMNQPTV